MKDICDFCKKEAVEETDFEAGNNAEIEVWVSVCKDHFKEIDNDFDYTFQERNFKKIEQLAAEQQRGE